MPPAWDDPNVTLETFIQVKISFKGTTRRYQFQLRDASAEALPRRVGEPAAAYPCPQRSAVSYMSASPPQMHAPRRVLLYMRQTLTQRPRSAARCRFPRAPASASSATLTAAASTCT